MTPPKPSRRVLWLCIALAAATVLAYWPIHSAQFLSMDDHMYVSDNTIVQQGLTWHGLVWAFNGVHVANYHPLTWLSHMLDCQVFGVSSPWHHRVNLLIHIANTLLLFAALRMMTARDWPSAFVAAVFALHPQHVESVAWVSERKDVLSGLFWMLTLIAYTKYVRDRSLKWYIAALLTFALGLLSKPMVITLPCVLLLLDFWPLRRGKLFLLEKVPFFALSVASGIATIVAQSSGGAVASIENMSLSFRVGNAIVAYVRYIRHFLLPTDLSAFYPLLRPWPLLTVIAAASVLLLVTAATVYGSKRRPWLGVGWLWFLGTLVPVIGLVQVGNQAMADRYMYLPLCGLALAITWTAAEWMNRRTAAVAATVVLAGCMSITMLDARAWRDSETLFTRALERTEPNTFALHNLSSALLLRGDTAGAIEKLEQCISLQPRNHHARRALGFALRAAGRLDEATKQLATALRIDQTDARTWNAMGHVYFDKKNWDAAADHFAAACELNPEDYDSRMNLATSHHNNGQNDLALADLRDAAKLNPKSPDPSYLAGCLLLEMNKPQEAIEPLTRATTVDPSHADAHYRLGLALMRCGQSEQATTALMRAAELSPQLREIILSKTD